MKGYTDSMMNHDEASYLKEYCSTRFSKYKSPCKTCRFRTHVEDIHQYAECMFANCPTDWEIDKEEK